MLRIVGASPMTPSQRLRALLVAGVVGSNSLVLALSGYSLYQTRQQHELRAEALTQNIAQGLEQNISGSIEKIDLALRTVSDELERQLASKGIDESATNVFLARQEQRLPEVENLRATNTEGIIILGVGISQTNPVSVADRDYFITHRTHADAALQISKPMMGRVIKKFLIPFARRYNYPDGSFAGTVYATMAVDHLTQLLSSFDLGPHGSLILRDADLGLITRFPAIPDNPAGQIGHSLVSPELKKYVEMGVSSATFLNSGGSDGVQRMITFHRLTQVPIIAIVGAAAQDYLASWQNEIYRLSAMAVGFLLLSLLLGGWLLRLLAQAEQRELALARESAKSKMLLRNASDGIHILDTRGTVIEASDSFCNMLGYTRAEVIGMNVHQWDTHFSPDEVDKVVAQQFERHEVTTFETRHRRKDGHVFDVELTGYPLDVEGQRVLFNSSRDISERKQAQAELEQHRLQLEELVQQRTAALMETEAKASHILQSSADGLYGVDVEGRVTVINSAACTMLGYRAEQVIGHSAHTLFHHSRPDGTPYPVAECPSNQALRTGQVIRSDHEMYWHADGHAIPVMLAFHPLLQDGKVNGGVLSFVDISVQRAAAQAREQALNVAENLVRVRSEFLANMGHEIRTPMNGVLGFAAIGRRHYQNSEKALNAFEKILESGNRLLGIITEIMDFSKINAGKMNFDPFEISLAEVIGNALEQMLNPAQAKHLDLRLELAPDLPPTCIGDPLHIGQILLNLLSNAVKFTDAGSITVSASRQGEQLLFRVTDTGIGMSQEQLLHLFNPFQQADASITRKFGGTGLGLAISKRLAELMKGDLRVESQLGSGSTFELRLPFVAAGLTP